MKPTQAQLVARGALTKGAAQFANSLKLTPDIGEDDPGDTPKEKTFCGYCGAKLNADGKCEECDDDEDEGDELAAHRRMMNTPKNLRALARFNRKHLKGA